MTRSVDLGDQLDQVVAALVDSGRFPSATEVLREGVRLIQQRDQHLAKLDDAIASGIAAANERRFDPADVVFDRLTARYKALVTAKE